MTRTSKIQKLGNAIRRYRSATHGEYWVHPPQRLAAGDIVRWCEQLNLSPKDAIVKIDAFKSFDEFNAWMKKI